MSNDMRDMIARAIHESRPGHIPWNCIPPSPSNPQRYFATLAADAVIALFSPGKHDPEDTARVLRK